MSKVAANTINIGWAIKAYGGRRPAVAHAEAKAAELLQADQNSSPEWAVGYISFAGSLPHQGDCPHARTWRAGPITCDACVYDEFMVKAWLALAKEIAAEQAKP